MKKLHFVDLEKTHVKLAFTAKTNRSYVSYVMVSTNGGEDGNKRGRKNMLQVVSFIILALNNTDIESLKFYIMLFLIGFRVAFHTSHEYNHVHEIGNSSGMRDVTYVLDGLNLNPSLALVCKDFTTLYANGKGILGGYTIRVLQFQYQAQEPCT
jgi:hypothetical protein